MSDTVSLKPESGDGQFDAARPDSATEQTRIRGKLGELRSAIKRYVWWEGLALAVAWLGLGFWLVLALDYLPVSLGLSEMPWQARAVLLVGMLLVLGCIIYRWILRRVLVRFSDTSLALLIERRFDQFEDGLATSVEFTGNSADASDRRMLQQTTHQAVARIDQVDVREVLNARPLRRALVAASIAIVSLLLLTVVSHRSSLLAAKRIFLLKDDPWPRTAHVELAGIRIKRDKPLPGLTELPAIIPFSDGRVQVARGSDVELVARAEADVAANPNRKVPRYCTIYYRLQSGESGRQDMNKIGRTEQGYQRYTFNQQPFKGIQSTLVFDLRGGDHRIGGFEIEVVDPPTVVDTLLDCRFPAYMVDEDSGAWTPRTIKLTAGTQMPIGTLVNMRIVSSKPLRAAYVHDASTGETQAIPLDTGSDPKSFEFDLARIESEVLLDITLQDSDGVFSDAPHRVYLAAVEDKAPRVLARVAGIGTAVTPNARIPFVGEVTDEYAVDRAWIEYRIGDEDPRDMNFDLPGDGTVDTAIDFDVLSRRIDDPVQLQPGTDQTLSVLIRAVDRFDLTGKPNEGVGDRYNLNVVSTEEMSRILERLEVGQRRRLEQIQEEMKDANEYLIRTKLGDELDQALIEPGENSSEERGSNDRDRVDSRELNLLYSQRALMQVRKSTQELLGVSDAFLNIRDQLVNNRLDRKDKRSRLEDDIASPLKLIGEESMAELELRIKALEARLKQSGDAISSDDGEVANSNSADEEVDALANAAIQQGTLVVNQIEDVLKILVKYESYSELLEVVRKMQEDQKRLLEETEKQRKKEQIGDLLD